MRLNVRWPALSELWSRYNLSSVIVDVGQLMGRNLLSLAISLGLAKVVTSVFTREQYGTYQFVIGIVASLGFFSLPGLNQVIMQETAKGHHGMLSHALRMQLKASLLYVIALLGLAGYYQFIAGQSVLALCFVATCVLFPLKLDLDCYRYYLLGRRDYALYARIPALVQIGVALITALTAWVVRDLVVVFVAMGVAEVILRVVAYRFVLKVLPPLNADYAQSTSRFGIGLSALNIMPSISARLGTILVGTLLSMPEVAALSLASMPLQKSKILLGPFGTFFGPRVVSQSGTHLFRRANRIMLVYVSIVLGYVLVMAAMMPLFFKIIFPDYMDVVPLARLAMFCMLPSAPANIMEMTLLSEERLKQTGIMRFAQFAFDLAVSFICIRTWGVAGAFVSRFLAGALRTCMVSVFYIRNPPPGITNYEQDAFDWSIEGYYAKENSHQPCIILGAVGAQD